VVYSASSKLRNISISLKYMRYGSTPRAAKKTKHTVNRIVNHSEKRWRLFSDATVLVTTAGQLGKTEVDSHAEEVDSHAEQVDSPAESPAAKLDRNISISFK
jgi:hypothetical protein